MKIVACRLRTNSKKLTSATVRIMSRLGIELETGENLMDPEENIPEDLKTRINSFLWIMLPGSTTLDQADELAEEIYSMISERWAKVKDNSK